MSSVKMRSILEGDRELLALLADTPNRAVRMLRGAQKRVGDRVASRVGSILNAVLRPRINKNGRLHLRDQYIAIQRVYRSSGTVVTIVGAQSGPGSRLSHIVEFGTAPRYTHHHSPKITEFVERRRARREKRPGGGWRTVFEIVKVRRRKSLSSRWTGQGLPDYRGIMPAFNQLSRAVQQSNVESLYEQELRAGLERIHARQAG